MLTYNDYMFIAKFVVYIFINKCVVVMRLEINSCIANIYVRDLFI